MKFIRRTIRAINPAAKALVPKGLYYWMWTRYFADRRYMEWTLLPAMGRMHPNRVLSVGVQVYCAHYGKYFNGSEFWTMDIDPDSAQYGQPGKHITASVIDVDQHFKPSYFDIISLNGIFGWGVNDPGDQKKTLANLRKIIRAGGVLLVGWNSNLTTDEIVSMAEANGFKYSNPLGLPNRKQFKGRTHVYDLFTAA